MKATKYVEYPHGSDHKLFATGVNISYKGFEICLDYCGEIVINGTTLFRGEDGLPETYPDIMSAVKRIREVIKEN